MSAPKLKKCRGLYTAANRYDVPEGALVTATNILIYKDGVIQPRWGLASDSDSMVTGNVSHWHRAAELNGTLWWGGRDTSANTLTVGSSATGSSFAGVTARVSSEDAPDGYANFTSSTAVPYFDMEFLKVGNLLYYNCARGLVRIESTSTQRLAGNYPCALSCFPRTLSVSNLARSGTSTATATVAIEHGYLPGIKVTIAGSSNAAWFANGEYTIVTVPSTTTFTYVDATDTGTRTGVTANVSASNLVGSAGFMAANDRVAYRALLVEYDTNGTEYTGEVSGRVVVTNAAPFIGTAADKNVQLAVLFPKTKLAANTKVELYRSKPVASAEPVDEMSLVYSKFLRADEISKGFTWITDINPDSEAGYGKALYTNGAQDGLLLNNTRPAGAKTAAVWKDRLVQGNTFDRPQIAMQLLSTDTSNGGLLAGDVLTVEYSGGTAYALTAVASGTALTTALKFYVYNTGGATSETDVKHTTLSLIDSLNWSGALSSATVLSPLGTWYAIYTSAPGDWPGKFTILHLAADQHESTATTALKRVVVGQLGATSTRGCFAPKLGPMFYVAAVASVADVVTVTTFGTHNIDVGESITVYSSWTNQTISTINSVQVTGTVTSTTSTTAVLTVTGTGTGSGSFDVVTTTYLPRFQGNHQLNNLRASKPKQFEAFPEQSTVRIGSSGRKLLKCVPCKDSLMVFKEDGLYRVTASGEYGESLSAELIDPNAILWAKDSAVAINGVIMAWLTKGVAIINEHGVQKYVSERISDKVSPATSQTDAPDLLSYPFSRRAQAFVDEKNNLYELRICLSSGPSAPYASTVNLIYNIENDTWVEDDLAVVSEVFYQGMRQIQQSTTFYYQTDQVYASANTSTNYSTFGQTDSTTKVATFTYTGSAPTVGSTVYDNDLVAYGYILSASAGSGTLYIPSGVTFVNTDIFSTYNPVISTIKWAPVTFNEENKFKRFKELEVLLGVREVFVAELTTASELVTTSETVTHKLGSFSTSVGVNGYAPYNLRQIVPQQHRVGQQLSLQLVFRTAHMAWTILGLGCKSDVLDVQVNRGNS